MNESPRNHTTLSAAGVSVPDTFAFELSSSVNGRRYAISISRPWTATPANGHAALVVLDAHQYFASAVAAVRAHPAAAHVAVIGIGYPADAEWISTTLAGHGPVPAALADAPAWAAACEMERFRDLTLPATEGALAAEGVPGLWSARTQDVGGLDAFLAMLSTDLLPQVSRYMPVDPADLSLFGHSLGGLAVLRALFQSPDRYRTCIASSPAIWWNGRAILEDEPAFHERVRSGAVRAQLIVSVGEAEAWARRLPPALAAAQARLDARVTTARMIDNACELAERLRRLDGGPAFRVEEFMLHNDVAHGLAPWASLARGIALAYPNQTVGDGDV